MVCPSSLGRSVHIRIDATNTGRAFGMKALRLLALLMMVFLLPGPARAQNSLTDLRASGSSFMYARYSTETASALYAARDFGPVSIVVGGVQNLRSGYREVMGGALSSVAYNRQTVTVAVAYTDATDAPYLQIYAMPTLTAGAVSMAATGLLYQPLGRSGTRQLELNPIMLLARLHSWLAFGGSYSVSVAAGASANQRAGLALQVHLAPGTITVEMLHGVERRNEELRISFWTGY